MVFGNVDTRIDLKFMVRIFTVEETCAAYLTQFLYLPRLHLGHKKALSACLPVGFLVSEFGQTLLSSTPYFFLASLFQRSFQGHSELILTIFETFPVLESVYVSMRSYKKMWIIYTRKGIVLHGGSLSK